MLDIWEKIYNSQENKLSDSLNNNDYPDEKQAAHDIINYRFKLKNEGYNIDEICYFSYKFAKELKDDAYKYGLNKRADGYSWIESYLSFSKELSDNTQTSEEFAQIINELDNKYLASKKD